MTHFTVLVINDDTDSIADELAPFHEFECTGYDDDYVQDVDVTEECQENGLDYHGLEDKIVTDEDDLDFEDTHKYGYAIVDGDGNLIKAVHRTNPNRQWDWWQLGGRWSGMLKLKPGRTGGTGERSWANEDEVIDETKYCDSAQIADIDFDSMRSDAAAKAAVEWDKARSANRGETWLSWEEVRTQYGWDEARDIYNSQPAIVLMKKEFDAWEEFDKYLVPREQYIQNAMNSVISTYAVLYKGAWYNRGDELWSGVFVDEDDKAGWSEQINLLIKSLPEDTVLSIVDCHV